MSHHKKTTHKDGNEENVNDSSVNSNDEEESENQSFHNAIKAEEKHKLGHQHKTDPKVFVDHKNLGVKTTTTSGKTLKLDRDVFRSPKEIAEQIKELEEKNKDTIFMVIGKFLLELSVILFIVFLIRTFIATPFQIDGNSMNDTLLHREKIFVNKIATYTGNIERGDIIVFEPPYSKLVAKRGPICKLKQQFSDEKDLKKLCGLEVQHYVKRVIATEGDILEIKEGIVYLTPIGGAKEELKEPYLNHENQGRTCFNKNCSSERDFSGETFIVPEESVFVLGDNRLNSTDSRSAFDTGSSFNNGSPEPFVPMKNIVGTVRVVVWPPSKWQWLSRGE